MSQNKRTSLGERSPSLKAVPFFTQLSEAEIELLRSLAAEKHYPKNAVVLTEGEMGDSLYMLPRSITCVLMRSEKLWNFS